MLDEGYIKFSLELQKTAPPEFTPSLLELNTTRTKLFDKNLIGILPEGIGFGNVSIRTGDTFVISGSATGGKRVLEAPDYSEVIEYDIEANSVWCRGEINASSESMSHGALYAADSSIRAVIHIHSTALFDYLLTEGNSATSKDTAYGTPAMAYELMDIAKGIRGPEKLIVMAGHQDGVIACGSTIEKTYSLIEKTYVKVFV